MGRKNLQHNIRSTKRAQRINKINNLYKISHGKEYKQAGVLDSVKKWFGYPSAPTSPPAKTEEQRLATINKRLIYPIIDPVISSEELTTVTNFISEELKKKQDALDVFEDWSDNYGIEHFESEGYSSDTAEGRRLIQEEIMRLQAIPLNQVKKYRKYQNKLNTLKSQCRDNNTEACQALVAFIYEIYKIMGKEPSNAFKAKTKIQQAPPPTPSSSKPPRIPKPLPEATSYTRSEYTGPPGDPILEQMLKNEILLKEMEEFQKEYKEYRAGQIKDEIENNQRIQSLLGTSNEDSEYDILDVEEPKPPQTPTLGYRIREPIDPLDAPIILKPGEKDDSKWDETHRPAVPAKNTMTTKASIRKEKIKRLARLADRLSLGRKV